MSDVMKRSAKTHNYLSRALEGIEDALTLILAHTVSCSEEGSVEVTQVNIDQDWLSTNH